MINRQSESGKAVFLARGGAALPRRSSSAATRSTSGTPDPGTVASAEETGSRHNIFKLQ
jgi:hypothetical protein